MLARGAVGLLDRTHDRTVHLAACLLQPAATSGAAAALTACSACASHDSNQLATCCGELSAGLVRARARRQIDKFANVRVCGLATWPPQEAQACLLRAGAMSQAVFLGGFSPPVTKLKDCVSIRTHQA
jgi:hypothetical protein